MKKYVTGIDIGSVSIGMAVIDSEKQTVFTDYRIHRGEIKNTLSEMIAHADLQNIVAAAVTDSTPSYVFRNISCDPQISVMATIRHLHPEARSVLIVGGEKFGLVTYDEKGNYLSFRSNTSCAAGTGSFLDQQAVRLNLSGISELGNLAVKNTGTPPRIASRCAVFAKTDLIHAQQQGYSLSEICDGLCQGLAKNICDTVFKSDSVFSSLVMCGGVSKNPAVVSHIKNLTGTSPVVDNMSHLYGAIGAALILHEKISTLDSNTYSTPDLASGWITETKKNSEPEPLYPELKLEKSDYPDFSAVNSSFMEIDPGSPQPRGVETDSYMPVETGKIYNSWLGIDIGSTSTKAVLLEKDTDEVIAGFYTRTAGRPLQAVQDIFMTVDRFFRNQGAVIEISGCATTGSGRKFIGSIIGADQMIDEITAHARAACHIKPDVDTIIEIGGQDAKFTRLKNGMVTGSTMNNVCAAGTGSFIEEQAKKLGCPISEFSSRTLGRRAPVASDRCTVFMERDLNHFLSEGHDRDTVLASVVHSVRDNYLMKVASEKNIGNVVMFQGATAKNEALVAAFEQRLGKPVTVSRYCHLTGALGAALILKDEADTPTLFRGIGLYRQSIPLSGEICQLCGNHCKITVADINGEKVAYGFLCGRDYETKSFVKRDTKAFELLKTREHIFKKNFNGLTANSSKSDFTVGIPAALHIYEDLQLWEFFFAELGIRTITGKNLKNPVKAGKLLSGAEFCAPVSALHAHVAHMLEKADYIFLPQYLEEKHPKKNIRRQYCYYTQFAAPLMSTMPATDRNRLLMPTVKYLYSRFYSKIQLYRMLKNIPGTNAGFMEVSAAFDRAFAGKAAAVDEMRSIFQKTVTEKPDDIGVVLLGRPYTVLSPAMNSGIPDIFANHGIDAFYQDMLPENTSTSEIDPLLNEIHWEHSPKIIGSAYRVTSIDKLYPVLITSFKCTPDSFTADYFKKIMDMAGKPYLILELDEHDSSVGYETRIEAAIRSFRNHAASIENRAAKKSGAGSINPDLAESMAGKTVVIPGWDPICCRFIAAILRREGIDARVMTETRTTIRESLKYNTGQCLPLTAIAEGFRAYLVNNSIAPENAVLWLSHSTISCNIRLYPHHIKTLLNSMGSGMEKAGVYSGELSMADVGMRAAKNTYFAYMFGGLLRKASCRIRPYETVTGSTDTAINYCVQTLEASFQGFRTHDDALAEVCSRLAGIKRSSSRNRPKVAIFGDMYTRDNDVMNQNLIRFIEEHGGEVITTPYSEYAKMIADQYFRKWFVEGQYFSLVAGKSLMMTMSYLEKKYYGYFEAAVGEPMPEFDDDAKAILSEYGILSEHTGESMDNILKIHYLVKHHPDLSLLVQASPALCCASLVTEAMSDAIQKKTGIPMVSVTYDGTGGNKNAPVIPYLAFPRTSPTADKCRAAG